MDVLKPIEDPLESLSLTLPFSSKDWGIEKRDAWVYGIICGWNDKCFSEFERKFGWNKETFERLKRLHSRFEELRRPAPENKPLTLEQLRKMDGEPVWVVFVGNGDWPPKAHWCFVRATKCILQVYPCAVHQAKNWMYTEQDFSCGVAKAYARKPEQEEK